MLPIREVDSTVTDFPAIRPVVKRTAGRRSSDQSVDPTNMFMKLFVISQIVTFAAGYIIGAFGR